MFTSCPCLLTDFEAKFELVLHDTFIKHEINTSGP